MSNQLPANIDLSAYQGDTWTQKFRLKLGDVPVNLTGATAACWAITAQKQVIKLVASVTDAINGEITLSVGTDGLPASAYTYDVEVTQSGTITTWIRGSLSVEGNITNAV